MTAQAAFDALAFQAAAMRLLLRIEAGDVAGGAGNDGPIGPK